MADFGRELRMVNGKLTKVSTQPIEKETMLNNMGVAMNMPYKKQVKPDGSIDESEYELEGMTYGEVIALRRV